MDMIIDIIDMVMVLIQFLHYCLIDLIIILLAWVWSYNLYYYWYYWYDDDIINFSF